MNSTASIRLRFGWVVLLLAAVLVGWVVFMFDPSRSGLYPFCPLHQFTGLYCAGCGTLRALHQLSHGHILQAFRLNPLMMLALPFLVWWAVRQLIFHTTGRKTAPVNLPASWTWVIFAAIMVFTILRNLPVAPFTLLAP